MGNGPTNPAETYFDKGLWGFNGTAWVKLPLVWGYTSRWIEYIGGTLSGDGTYTGATAVVPAGYVYTLEGICISNNSGARGYVYLQALGDSYQLTMASNPTPAQYIPDFWNGRLTLAAGDVARAVCYSCLDGDSFYGVVWGVKMAVT